ncbi:hypothetical protein LOTGIDRAFT_174719 [Lottia gigantea]|uniref:Paraoxonase n=1 Tax=Lottia gigantea TaxID=225164 RepID=V4AID6_LOTGI|nr:hypothetical protein LOTGIDRAFT_174719 [Lottia gigantea]ESO96727.1 hypothetical protein LOTGIDRAFT_174719 [Lottia gigantea]
MIIKIAIITVLAVILHPIIIFIWKLGLYTQFNKHYPGRCERVKGIGVGSEDFHVFRDGLTFITSGFRLREHDHEAMLKFVETNNVTGNIYLYDFNKQNGQAQKLSIEESDDFKLASFAPHGISGWDDETTGKRYLFVVNHDLSAGETIDKFLYLTDKQSLKHIYRYQDNTTMLKLNDVQATGVNTFYFTNFAPGPNKLLALMQYLGQFRWTTVVYYDGAVFRDVLTKMPISNGIYMSHDQSHVYIASNLDSSIMNYKREKNNELTLQQVYELNAIPDNILIDHSTGDLYVGTHPIGYRILNHLTYPSERAPSMVLQLKTKDHIITDTIELFYDHGDLITGSSVAYVYKNKLLVGSIMDTLVHCDINGPQ